MAANRSRKANQATAESDSQATEGVAGATAAGSGVESGSAARQTGAGIDVGMDIGQTEAWTVNMKRMVENAISLDAQNLTTAAESHARKVRNAENADDERQRLANLALNQAIENSNLLAKTALSERERTVRHSDLAINHQWNIDEQAAFLNEILRGETFKDAIAGAVAAAVAASLSNNT